MIESGGFTAENCSPPVMATTVLRQHLFAQFTAIFLHETGHGISGQPAPHLLDDGNPNIDGHFEVACPESAVELMEVIGHHAQVHQSF